ncbi:hypothetical protein H5410_023862 [Solanum commersonii]|uniref:Uncharacterized protein n=1 Tax=Solanum commersonii TaxID=4109 RepID=A0A9J5ZKB8_SOLCO|nr:hypothetical protein H5410_023862 [Solanum commersonii]
MIKQKRVQMTRAPGRHSTIEGKKLLGPITSTPNPHTIDLTVFNAPYTSTSYQAPPPLPNQSQAPNTNHSQNFMPTYQIPLPVPNNPNVLPSQPAHPSVTFQTPPAYTISEPCPRFARKKKEDVSAVSFSSRPRPQRYFGFGYAIVNSNRFPTSNIYPPFPQAPIPIYYAQQNYQAPPPIYQNQPPTYQNTLLNHQANALVYQNPG